MSVQSFCGEDKGFCGEDKDFMAKRKGFLVKTNDFFKFFFAFTKNPSFLPVFTLHTNEGGTYTEHV